MPRSVKATTNARRKMTFADFDGLSKDRPVKSLTRANKIQAGRDRLGRISVRHQGGGKKRLYRLIDFKFLPHDGVTKVLRIEYDPNRSAYIALVETTFEDKSPIKRYIIAPANLKVGDKVTSGVSRRYQPGSRMKLADIPIGYELHNIELQPGRGAQMVRSAGSWAVLTAKEGKFAHIKLPSSEIRKVLLECMASIGRVSNPTHNLIRIAKAGRKRLMGVRPSVRGKVMSPKAHPHGGGEGVNPIGLKYPKTPWGKPALGVKTRRNKRTNVFIVSRRGKKR